MIRVSVSTELPARYSKLGMNTEPLKICVSVGSSPNTFEPLEKITDDDSIVTFNFLALIVSNDAVAAIIS